MDAKVVLYFNVRLANLVALVVGDVFVFFGKGHRLFLLGIQ